jgi:hypothetical protein
MTKKKRNEIVYDKTKLQKLNQSATSGKNKRSASDFLDDSSDDEEEAELNPVLVAKAVRECCKTYDQRGNKPDSMTFRKQVELECRFKENHLIAYQGVIDQMRRQQNKDLWELSHDQLTACYSDRRKSTTKEMAQTQGLRNKTLKAKGIGKADEKHSQFYKYRRASTDLLETKQHKNRKTRYSQVLGKSTSDTIQERNRKMQEKDKKHREKKAKRATGQNKQGSANEGRWKKQVAKAGPFVKPRRRRFERMYNLFSRPKHDKIEPMHLTEAKEEEEEQEEAEPVVSDADTVHYLANTAPSEW